MVLLLPAMVGLAACRGVLPAAGEPSADAGIGVVAGVVDGDTVDVRIGGGTERVRLVGVDTPETVDREQPVECFGEEASQHTKALLPEGTRVRVERDDVARDRYGRLLAYLYREADGLLVNLALVEGGFADAVSYGDNEALSTVLSAAEAEARSTGAGLWSACGGPDVDIAPAPAR